MNFPGLQFNPSKKQRRKGKQKKSPEFKAVSWTSSTRCETLTSDYHLLAGYSCLPCHLSYLVQLYTKQSSTIFYFIIKLGMSSWRKRMSTSFFLWCFILHQFFGERKISLEYMGLCKVGTKVRWSEVLTFQAKCKGLPNNSVININSILCNILKNNN